MNTLPIVENHMILENEYLEVWVDVFLQAKKAENLSKNTLRFYKINLAAFLAFCDTQAIKTIQHLSPTAIRDFLMHLENTGHNAGGIHVFYRSVRAFLRWVWEENDIETRNPIDKVKAPRLPREAIQGVTMGQFDLLLDACRNDRDRTILLVLLDTGVRADELCNIRIADVSLTQNSILVRMGKGRKPRSVFFGYRTRRQIRKYLRIRKHKSDWLFINKTGEKLEYVALRQIIRRLNQATALNIRLHDFRRAFTLSLLQKNVDLVTISRLLGHTTINLISRYANQSNQDLKDLYTSTVDS